MSKDQMHTHTRTRTYYGARANTVEGIRGFWFTVFVGVCGFEVRSVSLRVLVEEQESLFNAISDE